MHAKGNSKKKDAKENSNKNQISDFQYSVIRWLKITFTLAICLCIGIPLSSRFTTAKDEDFDINKGFDDTQQDKVWATYNVTDWDEVGGLQFSDDSLIVLDNKILNSAFTENDDSGKKNGSTGKQEIGIIEKELKKYKGKTYFKKENYRKLFLCIAYVLNQKGYKADWAKGAHQQQTVEDISEGVDYPTAKLDANGNPIPGEYSFGDTSGSKAKAVYEETQEKLADADAKKNSRFDIMFLHEIYGLDEYPKSKEEGYDIIISKYFAAEQAYLKASDDTDDMDYSINDTTSTGGLKCVLQATLYGNGYIRAKEKCNYSEGKSKSYRKNHPDDVNVEFDDFPEVILNQSKNIFGSKKQALYSARPIENIDQTTVQG